MDTLKNPRTKYMQSVITIIFATAAFATVASAFLIVNTDRGLFFWLATGFALLVEMIAFILATGLSVSPRQKGQISTPIIVTSCVILALYAFFGVISIIIYSLIRNTNKPDDRVFAAILLIETTLAFILILLTQAWDKFFQAGQPPFLAQREEHRVKGLVLQPIISKLRKLEFRDNAHAIQLGKIVKILEVAMSGLLHSHGGGVGSRESGLNALKPAAESEINDVLDRLDVSVNLLLDGVNTEQRVAEVQLLTEHLQRLISALQLD